MPDSFLTDTDRERLQEFLKEIPCEDPIDYTLVPIKKGLFMVFLLGLVASGRCLRAAGLRG